MSDKRSRDPLDSGGVSESEDSWLTPTVTPGDLGSQPTFEKGARLGRYVVLSPLGHGGMGSVFSAFDPELDRKVAIKVLRGEVLTSEKRDRAQARLRREAQAIAKLAHPNVVSVYDVGTVGDRLFVAMELIEGQTLAEWLRSQPRSWRAVLRVFEDAGRGLAAAHDAGLVHRDFKPSNVMISNEGRVRVLDFGLAKQIEAASDDLRGTDGSGVGVVESRLRDTASVGAAGTPAYMSPEQHAGRVADHRSDQFSFCVALFEALYGVLPFPGRARSELAASVSKGELTPPPARSPVSGPVRRAVQRGLSVDARERFPSMDDLLDDLSRKPASVRYGRIVGAVVLAFALVSLAFASFFRSPESAQLCQGGPRRLQGIWDEPRKQEVKGALLGTGVPYAAGVWDRIEERVDSYVGVWKDAYVEACEATRVFGDQSEEILDLRMSCLDERLGAIDAAASLLAQADEQIVRNALALTNLPVVQECSDAASLSALEATPEDPQLRATADRLRRKLEDVKTLDIVGKYEESFSLASDLLKEAGDAKLRRLTGQANLQLGILSGRLGRRDNVQGYVLQAASIGQASRDLELSATSLNYLILASFLRGDPEQAHIWERLASAAVEAQGGDAKYERQRLFFLGMTLQMEGRYEEAIEQYLAYLDLIPADRQDSYAAGWNNIAQVKLENGAPPGSRG